MRGYKTPEIVANEIRMLRSRGRQGPFLLVEGDTDVQLGVKDKALRDATDTLLSARPHQEELCRGHDLLDLLVLGLQRVLGSCDAREVTGAHLERELRLAFSQECLEMTALFQAIRAWERESGCPIWAVRQPGEPRALDG